MAATPIPHGMWRYTLPAPKSAARDARFWKLMHVNSADEPANILRMIAASVTGVLSLNSRVLSAIYPMNF